MGENKDIQAAFKPSEIIGIVSATLLKQSEAAQVVYVEGIFQARQSDPKWTACYGSLRDANSGEEISVKMSRDLRSELDNGKLVTLGGLLSRSVNEKGFIQLVLNVTRIVGQKEAERSEADEKRLAALRKKQQRGYKNLEAALEQCLLRDERPKVAMVMAAASITMTDFNRAIHAAKANVDFQEFRANFANSDELCETLRRCDGSGFDAVAIVRGGGSGIEKLDEIAVLEAVADMQTATISAIGHADERLTFKEVVDKEVATPTSLGQYFSELCERVASEKAKSKAVLVEQVRKQFAEQITSLEKRVSEQDKAHREERAAYQKQLDEQAKASRDERAALIAQQGKNADELAEMRNKVKWMAGKMNEQKRKIVWLAVGLAASVLLLIVSRL